VQLVRPSVCWFACKLPLVVGKDVRLFAILSGPLLGVNSECIVKFAGNKLSKVDLVPHLVSADSCVRLSDTLASIE